MIILYVILYTTRIRLSVRVIYVRRHDYYYYYLLFRLSSFALVSLFLSPPAENQILLNGRKGPTASGTGDDDNSLRIHNE